MNNGIDSANAGLTALIYALQALSLVTGVTLFAAAIMNYVKRDDVRGSWLESHFQWQIRTFWWSLLWTVLGALTLIVLIGYLILGVELLWFIYRVIKGWLWLRDGKSMYDNPTIVNTRSR
jgi:uncharacterized membrane protein